MKVKLAILYALRYEKLPSSNLASLIDLLQRGGVSERKISVR
jgi:hypothetical protein